MYNQRDSGMLLKAKGMFGAGVVEMMCGDTAPQFAPARFMKALDLCAKADPTGSDPAVRELRGDILMRSGTVNRVSGHLDEAENCYSQAQAVFGDDIVRGHVWLVPERAELERARAFSSHSADPSKHLAKSAALFEEGKVLSRRIRNVNWFAHCLIGECELARVGYQKFKKALPPDIGTKYANAFEIYCQISSHWGIAGTFISEALLFRAAPETFPDQYAAIAEKLEQAERFGKELGLKSEITLIRRLKSSSETISELHPLIFL